MKVDLRVTDWKSCYETSAQYSTQRVLHCQKCRLPDELSACSDGCKRTIRRAGPSHEEQEPLSTEKEDFSEELINPEDTLLNWQAPAQRLVHLLGMLVTEMGRHLESLTAQVSRSR